MAVTWTYNAGAATVNAAIDDAVSGDKYELWCSDSNSSPTTVTASSSSLSVTVNGIGGDAAGYGFGAYLYHGTSSAVSVSSPCVYDNVFAEGTSSAGAGLSGTWAYDGSTGISVTITAVGGVGYNLAAHVTTGTISQVNVGPFTDGSTQIISLTTAAPTSGRSFWADLSDTSTSEDYTNRVFVEGVAGTGSPGNPGGVTPVVTPEGVLIAFDDDALAPTPTWTRIDNIQGVNVAAIQIKRGRPDARSKSSVGTAKLGGYDMVGDTDPTNPSGSFFGDLEPTKQSQILLYNPITVAWLPIYTGFTSDWTHVLDVSEKKLDFTLDLEDMLGMFNDAEIAPDQAGNTVPGESKGDVFYTGAHVDDRLLAVLADAGVDFPAGIFQPTWPNSQAEASGGEIASGNVFVQGRVYANRTTLLQIIDEACDAEGPGATNRFITKDGFFAFRGRYYRYTPGHFIPADGIRVSGQRMLHWHVGDIPAWQLDNTLAVYTGLTFTRGKTNLINASLVTPLGIADLQISDQFVADPVSVGLYGPRTEGTSYENIITGDADDGNDPFEETASFGLATIANYNNPVTRVSQVVFRNPPAGADPARAAATWDLLCNIELSDLITITSTHPGGGGFDAVDHFVEGITYDIKPLRGDEWDVTLTLDLSPTAYFNSMPNTWTPSETGLLAEFTTSPDPPAGAAPLSVTFTDDSSAGPSGPIVSRHWDFGDGSTSSSTSPTHSFTAAGGYLVVLTITGTGSDGTSSVCCYVRAT